MENSTLIINGEQIHTFNYPIDSYLIKDDKIFVLLDLLARGSHNNENVYCLDFEGNIIWQMEKIKRVTPDSPVVHIELANNTLKAIDWNGENFTLDINTGKILETLRGKGYRLW
jgi:outer membrane protein assembly factor BamB